MRSRAIQASLITTCLILCAGMVKAETLSLEGKVEHSESVSPFDNISVGTKFDENSLPRGENEGHWWRVPKWLQGHWHKTGKIEILAFHDLQKDEPVPFKKHVTVSYPHNEVIGHQTDQRGQVWAYVPIPSVVKTVQGNHINVNVINGFDVMDEQEESITIRIFAVTVMVDNTSHKVISICQRESLQTWNSIRNNEVTIHDSTKFFDRDGVPIFTKKMLSHTKKCASFSPVNFIDRISHSPTPRQDYYIPTELCNSKNLPIDLRTSFAEYLRTHNLSLLIP